MSLHPHRSHPPTRAVVVAVVLAVAVLAGIFPASADPAAADDVPAYQPPVDAPVHDPFRAPEHAYGSGNRGIEYDTPAGTDVAAAAGGKVTFAGWVAGTQHVTVLHADGVRTTASYLDTVSVVVGQELSRGDLLGTTTGRLHFGARRGDAYFDPASLFGEGPIQVRLVPFDLPPGAGVGGERSAISQLLGYGGALLRTAGDAGAWAWGATGDAATWAWDETADLREIALRYAPLAAQRWVRAGLLAHTAIRTLHSAWTRSRRDCTDDDEPIPQPTERRVGVLVAGFGSSSGGSGIDDLDTAALGYHAEDVMRFSYAGGRIPGSPVRLASLPVTPYGSSEANQDLWDSGALLADLIEQVAAVAPGVPVDLLAHSQGGVVARLALLELEARHGQDWLERIGLLATIGTPHDGADFATAGAELAEHPLGAAIIEGVDAGLGYDVADPAMRQLAEGSAVIRHLGREGLPEGLDAVSIGARGDLIVPAPRTGLDGARETTVPLGGLSAHDKLPGDPRTTREVALALAQAPPRCVAFDTALADLVVGDLIGAAETLLGDGVAVASDAPLASLFGPAAVGP